MSKSWFVTGTDTGVGKTAVSCALLAAARRAGLRTAAIKPVAAGCDEANHNDDALQLMDWMTESLDYEQVNPVALRAAIAPHIAAQREGRSLQASRLAGLCRGVMLGGAQFVLIEGAGGWRVPINGRETLADLAIQLQVGVILVVGMRLGCINHALLTARAIATDGCRLLGWIGNLVDPQMSVREENLAAIAERMDAPCLGVVPHLTEADPRVVADHLDAALLLRRLT